MAGVNERFYLHKGPKTVGTFTLGKDNPAWKDPPMVVVIDRDRSLRANDASSNFVIYTQPLEVAHTHLCYISARSEFYKYTLINVILLLIQSFYCPTSPSCKLLFTTILGSTRYAKKVELILHFVISFHIDRK